MSVAKVAHRPPLPPEGRHRMDTLDVQRVVNVL